MASTLVAPSTRLGELDWFHPSLNFPPLPPSICSLHPRREIAPRARTIPHLAVMVGITIATEICLYDRLCELALAMVIVRPSLAPLQFSNGPMVPLLHGFLPECPTIQLDLYRSRCNSIVVRLSDLAS